MSTEEKLFAVATKLPVSKRDAFLQEACDGDKALHKRLLGLLSAHESENHFLDLAEVQSSTEIQRLSLGNEIGQYRLLQILGEGGFGIVYLAEQQQPIQRKVAIKVIKPGMDSRAVIARFEGEWQALAMMEHPNIARVFDGGESDDGQRPYFVMELVQGVPITEYCDNNLLSTRERLELFVSVCNAVHHAHQKGIIHRDIKPSNVMVTLHDGKPVVKIIDFGVAKALHQPLTEKTLFTQYGTMVGTLQYMSPEQAEMTGLDADTRSDIYSLAVLLYELMTGTTPLEAEQFRNAGLRELQQLICEEEPLRPSLRLSTAGENLTTLAKHRSVAPDRLSREVKGDLDWIIMKGLEKDRTRRYESAKDLAADIYRTINHQPVVAGPPSFLYRSRKFARRNRVTLTLVAAALGMATALILGLLNHRQHRLAAVQKDEARLNGAVEEANAALVDAVETPNSSELWTAADLMAVRIENLVDDSLAGRATISRAESFLERFDVASQDRQFTFSMEELLVRHSTGHSIESLQAMEQGFRQILKNRGYDLDYLSPNDVASRLKSDHAPIKLTDALELWLATRMKLGEKDGQGITTEEIQRWTDAICVADPNQLRTAIRATIFQTGKPEKTLLDSAVETGDLSTMCARKLSWLAQAYELVGEPERAAEIREYALALHSDDLMLNYDYAIRLMNQQRSDKAIRYLMRCTSIRPGNPGVWAKLAESYGQNDELHQAQEAIKIAIGLESNNAEYHLQLSQWLLEDKQSNQAIASAKAALSLDESLNTARRIIGRANMELGKYPQALVAFEEFQIRAGKEERTSVDEWINECQQQIGSGH